MKSSIKSLAGGMALITSAHLVEANNLMTTTQAEAEIAKKNCDVMLILSDGSEYVCMVSIDDGKTWQEYTPAILATLLAGAAAGGALLWRRRKKGVESVTTNSSQSTEDSSQEDREQTLSNEMLREAQERLVQSRITPDDSDSYISTDSHPEESSTEGVMGERLHSSVESMAITQDEPQEDNNTQVLEEKESSEEQFAVAPEESSIESASDNASESHNIEGSKVDTNHTELAKDSNEDKKLGIFERLKNRFGRLFGSSQSDKVITESQSGLVQPKIDEIPNPEIITHTPVSHFESSNYYKIRFTKLDPISLEYIEGLFYPNGSPKKGLPIKLPPVFPEYISPVDIASREIPAIEIKRKIEEGDHAGKFQIDDSDQYIDGSTLIEWVNRYISEYNMLVEKKLEERRKKLG